jgi:hypothetical protein
VKTKPQDPRKRILAVSFDGVLHSDLSGWKGARHIDDRAIPGAMAFLLQTVEEFDVQIFSVRSRYWFGRYKMKKWLRFQMWNYLRSNYANLPKHWKKEISERFFMATEQDDEFQWAARLIIAKIKFPRHKPIAHLTLDDRAMQFRRIFPSNSTIENFRPWRLEDLNKANRVLHKCDIEPTSKAGIGGW